MWPGPLPAYVNASHLAPNLNVRRHRSMTPHPPNISSFTADPWQGDQGRTARPFTQAVGGIFNTHFADESYHRATSLDPSTLNVRATSLQSQGPNYFNRFGMGSTNMSGDGQPSQFDSGGQTGITSVMSLTEPTTIGELKTNLVDEYTDWEQHNA